MGHSKPMKPTLPMRAVTTYTQSVMCTSEVTEKFIQLNESSH